MTAPIPAPPSRAAAARPPRASILAILALALGAAAPGTAQTAARSPSAVPRYEWFARQVDDLAGPMGVAIAADGSIWVAETDAHRIRVLDRNGATLRTFGRPGTGPGQFLDPIDIAIDDDAGEVVVLDAGNHRIQVFDRDGTLLRTFGRRGRERGELDWPTGLALGPEKTVWVADAGNDRIQVLDAEVGTPRLVFGLYGDGPGELRRPVDIVISPLAGDVFVVEADNQRVQKFGAGGAAVTSWGGFGPFPGLFSEPSGAAWRAGHVYVTDRRNHRVQIFDESGRPAGEWGLHTVDPHEGHGRMHYPDRIAIAPDGSFAVVCEAFEDRIQIFSAEGTSESETVLRPEPGRTVTPHFGRQATMAGRLLALTDPDTNTISVYDTGRPDPVCITRFGGVGTAFGLFVNPTGLQMSPDGRTLRVCDQGGLALQLFDLEPPDPEALLKFDPRMSQFARAVDFHALTGLRPELARRFTIEPVDVVGDAGGNLHLIDRRNGCGFSFSPKLQLLHAFGAEVLRKPVALALDATGAQLLVADAHTDDRVHVFDAKSGRHQRSFGRGGDGPDTIVLPGGITAGDDATVFVTDARAHQIVKLDAEGKTLARWGRRGLGPVEFFKPAGLARDGHGRLVVVDHGNHRVQILSPDGEFIHAFGARRYVLPTKTRDREEQQNE